MSSGSWTLSPYSRLNASKVVHDSLCSHQLSFLQRNESELCCGAAALQFARTEGIIPAPEPTHAIAAAIREAMECKRTGEQKVILMAMCGHGHFDLAAYDKYLRGDMVDLVHPEDKLEESLAAVPKI
jgi:glutamate-1-semialdehyde aminotransferase